MLKKIFKNKSIQNGGLYLFGNLFNKAIAFITVPIFSRILSTSDYGITSTYSSWESILAVIIGLALGNSIRNAYVDYKEDLNGYISSIFSLALINFLCVSLILFFINLNFSFITPSILLLCLLHSFGSFLINSIVIKYMMAGESKKRTILLVIPNLVASIISIIAIINISENKYYGRIIPMAAVFSMFGLGIYINSLKKGKKFYDKTYWKYGLTLSLPLILHGLSVNILSTSDRTLITAFRTASETGIYSLVYNFGMIALVITSSLESVWIPFFTRKMQKQNKNEINNAARVFIDVCTFAFCGLLIVSPETLVVFASEKYRSGIGIIAPIVLASYFQFLYSFAVNAEYYYKKTAIIARNTIIAAAINLCLNLIFIPIGGAIAAAYTTVIAYAFSFVLHYRYCRKIDGEILRLDVFYRSIILIFIFVGIQYITLHNPLLRWSLGIILLIVIIIVYYKKESDNLLMIIKGE